MAIECALLTGTGQAHPLALQTPLRYTAGVYDSDMYIHSWSMDFQIWGDLIALNANDMTSRDDNRMIVWNWKTSSLLWVGILS